MPTVQPNAQYNLVCLSTGEPHSHGTDYLYHNDGTGVRIYIIDNGVREADDLEGKIVDRAELTSATAPTGSHGTSGAAVAVGTQYGVAKGAVIVDVHAYDDPPADATPAATIAAHNWILNNHPTGVRGVIHDPWGLPLMEDSQQNKDDMAASYQALIDAGFCVTLSAANLNDNLGNDGLLDIVQGVDEIVYVGNVDENHERNPNSNYGPNVEIYAGGTDLTLPRNASDGTHVTSGTSWTSPAIAGIYAMLLQEHPNLTPMEAKTLLLDQGIEGQITGLPVGSDSHNLIAYSLLEVEEPFSPSNFVVIIDGSTAQLSWDAVDGVTDYYIFRRTPSTGEEFDPITDTPIAIVDTLTYDDEELDNGVYDWQVFGLLD